MNNNNSTIAAIDLGSNSFHMIVAKLQNDEIRILDKLGEKVQLSDGLDTEKRLDVDSMHRGFSCLEKFAQLLHNINKDKIRVVGTSALRDAINSQEFIDKAEDIIGVPIEIIAGREEARLVYLGVSHFIHNSCNKRLVVDIGGGSTEFIAGIDFDIAERESLNIGCVRYTKKFFNDHKINNTNFKDAYNSACLAIMNIERTFKEFTDIKEFVGSSGTVKAVQQAIFLNTGSEEITKKGLEWLYEELIKAGEFEKININGIKEDRKPIIAAGVAILSATFDRCHVSSMIYSDGALREGIIYSMFGRDDSENVRTRTINAFMDRFSIDKDQARRVEEIAMLAFDKTMQEWGLSNKDRDILIYAARLHETGLSVAHSGYHKHGAYLIANADMPGFSATEQQKISFLVLNHRRKVLKDEFKQFSKKKDKMLYFCVLLRYAFLINRIRAEHNIPSAAFKVKEHSLEITFPYDWLTKNPLTAADMYEESIYLKPLGFDLVVK